jgi:UDP-N-acetylmuramyl pentapeptide phosphotransferase/UDP-N-acetylglucosamine-1-phosphate transferase
LRVALVLIAYTTPLFSGSFLRRMAVLVLGFLVFNRYPAGFYGGYRSMALGGALVAVAALTEQKYIYSL